MNLIPRSVIVCIFAAALLSLGAGPGQNRRAADCEKKLQFIEKNGAAAHPSTAPTLLTEDEINAYLAAGKVQFPQGVKKVAFEGAPNQVTAHARVDFDEITAGKRSVNPLLSLFTGVHDVDVVADANGTGGTGVVHVQSVALDGTNIPRIALEYFVDHYIKPKHPEIGLDTRFQMPYRIDRAEVGGHTLTIRQR